MNTGKPLQEISKPAGLSLADEMAQSCGLTQTEASRRLAQYGPNELGEKKESALIKFLGYFWGPIRWMIEVAAVLSAVVGHWVDLTIVLVLFVFNAKSVSHFQKAVLTIGDFLIYLSLGLAALLLLTMLARGEPVLTLFQFALILVVAAIPVAMPAVLSVTMAIGAVVLARKKAILTRLEAIEEMAGMDILCSDKTGTLTQNKLTLGESAPFSAKDAQALVLSGALASKAEARDAIDMAVLDGLKDSAALATYHQGKFTPFDLIHKRTEAEATEGFAEVFPEHKYQIVKALQSRGHIVGMTGDGVNDGPALKLASGGIAVSGATDAARAAAALVLTEPGLSVIIQAVEKAPRIFERMNSYAIYRITETVR